MKPPAGGFLAVRQARGPACCAASGATRSATRETYWSKWKNVYFPGDGAHRDARGYFWIMGRIDDVMNVSGHRIGTMEVESAIVSHPKVAEAAVVGRPDDLTGTAMVAFVTPRTKTELGARVQGRGAQPRREDDRGDREAGRGAASPTRSRRRAPARSCADCLRDIAAGKETVGDTTTLEDYSVLARIRETEEV